jgi:WD40-like Beta Propeller Repeat
VNRRKAASWLILASVVVLGAVAANDALRSDEAAFDVSTQPDESALTGPNLPARGELPGTLVFVSQAGCRPFTVSLGTLSLGAAGPSVECGLWVPARGELAAVSLSSELGLRGSRVALLRLDEPLALAGEIGIVRGQPSWSADGRLLAWCTPRSDTVVLDLETDARHRVAGCRPTIAPDGSVLTRPARLLTPTLLRNGDVLLDRQALLQPFPEDEGGPLDVVGYDEHPNGLLAVVAVRFESGRLPRRILQLWRGYALERAVELPELNLPAGYGRLGDHVEFDPSGREVAVSFPGAGKQMLLVDIATGQIVLPPTSQHGFAWSPDGTWFALSTGDEIELFGPGRSEPKYVLPLGAASLAWR